MPSKMGFLIMAAWTTIRPEPRTWLKRSQIRDSHTQSITVRRRACLNIQNVCMWGGLLKKDPT